MRFLISIFVSVLFTFCLNAQSISIDSLIQELTQNRVDTSSVNALNEESKQQLRKTPIIALQLAQLANIYSENLDYSLGKIISYENIGTIKYIQEEYDSAFFFLERGFSIAEKISNLNHIGTLAGKLALLYERNGATDKAEEYYLKALGIFEKNNDKKGLAATTNNLGGFYKHVGNKNNALNYYKQALKWKFELKDSIGQATTMSNIGGLYEGMGEYDIATDYALKALKIHENYSDPFGKAAVLNLLGQIQSNLNNYENSLKYFQQALDNFKLYGKQGYISYGYNNVGGALLDMGKDKEALPYFRFALKIKEEIGDKKGSISTLGNIAKILSYNNEADSSILFARKALKIAREINYNLGVIRSLRTLGKIYYSNKSYKIAIKFYNESAVIATSVNANFELHKTLRGLSEVYAKQNNFKQAFDTFQKCSTLKDSLFALERIEITEKYQAKYNLQKKDTELAQKKVELKSNELLINQQKQQANLLLLGGSLLLAALLLIYSSYRRKKLHNQKINLLHKELNHRVKNNLATINRMVKMERRMVKNPETKSIMIQIETRIEAMSLIHRKFHSPENDTKIHLSNYLYELCGYLNRTNTNGDKEVKIKIQCEDIQIRSDLAMNLGLIVNELVTNSFKHAFSKQENPIIDLKVLKNRYKELVLDYKDNGIGIPDMFNIDKLESAGTKLVNLFTAELQGTIRLKSDNGIDYHFIFKKPELLN